MGYKIRKDDRMGLVRPYNDAHTLGMSSIANLLEDCGIKCFIGDMEVCREIANMSHSADLRIFINWIRENGLTVLGFSYRLDTADGLRIFSLWYKSLAEKKILATEGGPIRAVYFAGLPPTCDIVKERFPDLAGFFRGDETPSESLAIFGIDPLLMPAALFAGNEYDNSRMRFGSEIIKKCEYRNIEKIVREYPGYGTVNDTVEARVKSGRTLNQGPLMRAHVGPYTGNAAEDFKLFRSWTKELAAGGLLDVLSIGTSQLTQSHFFEDRTDLVDGGGISIRTPADYGTIWKDARPMLVRTYAGTRDIPKLASMHEQSLHIAWHALSFWWFCQLDGRGPYGLEENLEQHFDAMRFVASSGKPLEPNVPHHFAFRGADDVTYVVAGYLAAKAAKKAGIRTLILQIMLNTPKYTSGLQDLAKARALRSMVRTLEDRNFSALLQGRGGLDYFSPDLEKAKIQLAAVSALMADIDPPEFEGPSIIHVVSYSEAVRLADPAIINESIRITRQSFSEYQRQRDRGQLENINLNQELACRTKALVSDAFLVIRAIEKLIRDPYSPRGFYEIFKAGFLPVPWLWECREQFPEAVRWDTRPVNGAITVVDTDGKPISAADRMAFIEDRQKGKKND